MKHSSTSTEQKEDESKHIMAKELVLSDKEHEKLEYNKCLKISEVEPFILD